MHDRDLRLRRRQGARERRVGVAVHQHRVGPTSASSGSSAPQHARGLRGVRAAADLQLAVGLGETELGEEDLRERLVVVLAGVHQHLLVLLPQRPRDGGGLDELGAVADDREDLHATQPTQAAAPTTDVDQSITEVGLTTWRLQAELLGLQPERQADQLGQVQDRHVQLAADDVFGERLLQVEVQVAQRAGRHQAVGVGVDRVAEMAAGLLERGLLVHRDDREAAALAHAGVLDHGAAERLDHLLEVVVARVLGVDPQALARAHDVAAVEGADLQVGQRAACTFARSSSRPISSTSSHRKFLLVRPFS